MMDDERWVDCPGFEGRYMVSDQGRVKNSKTGRVLTLTLRERGHFQVTLYRADGSSKDCSVARLLCTAFHGSPPSPCFIAGHRNDTKTDNRAENLCWEYPGQRVGEGNPNARLRDEDVVEMRRMSRAGATYAEVAARFDVAISTAFAAVIGRRWKHVPDAPPAHQAA
jgi:hypothetical protein